MSVVGGTTKSMTLKTFKMPIVNLTTSVSVKYYLWPPDKLVKCLIRKCSINVDEIAKWYNSTEHRPVNSVEFCQRRDKTNKNRRTYVATAKVYNLARQANENMLRSVTKCQC